MGFTTKDFDCVRMKHEIQAQLDRQFEGMSDEEIRREQRRLIEEDPILGTIYRKERLLKPLSVTRPDSPNKSY